MSAVDPQQQSKPKKKWTVLIYMAGDNNLSEECVYSLTEIKEAIDDENRDLIVLAQFDPHGVRAETKRYQLTNRYKLKEDAELTGWIARETDTGEPYNLLEFIRWGISQYPAHRYLLVLVGHGSGTDDDFLLRDENPPNSLGILELREVFEQLTNDGHRIDIVGFDTCLMNMAEVCFELNRTKVTYLVGSEGFSPNTGWPYAEILRVLSTEIKAGREVDPDWLAKRIVSEYQKFYIAYINGGISVDQSVLEVEKVNVVKNKMFLLVEELLKEVRTGQLRYESPKQNALLLAHWEAQSYNGEVFIDLHDFCDRLAARYPTTPASNVATLCRRVSTAIDALVLKCCVAGAAFQFSYGLSTYFPWAILSQKYGNLSWPKETKWLDFLQDYHDLTRRPGRRIGDTKFPKPGRASVPVNKGRDGKVESMRNPPAEEVEICVPREAQTNGGTPPDPKGTRGAVKRRTKKGTRKRR